MSSARPVPPTARRRGTRRAHLAMVLVTALLPLVLTGCGGADDVPEDARARNLGSQDVVSAVRKDARLSATLPAEYRESGVLRVGSAIGVPPIAFSPEDGGPPRGVDIDMIDAVARVLGLKVQRTHVSGASMITGINAGRYQVGTANLAVTKEREQVLDFVLYLTDGSGFAVRDDSALKQVRSLAQLCGLRVGTGTGTTFEAELQTASKQCVADGGKPIGISTYPDAASHFLALRQGRVDVLMTSSSVLRYAATQQPGLRYLNEIERKNVGFAVKKSSPLAEPLKNAVDNLIQDGTYAKILKKWNLRAAAVPAAEINPGPTP